MNLKHFLKPILYNGTYSHMMFGFFITGLCCVFLPMPWPLISVIVFATIREILQNLKWPWNHDDQTLVQNLKDIAEFVLGGSFPLILTIFLKYHPYIG